jgi:diguanylate cyclase (GGDEF)-like protein
LPECPAVHAGIFAPVLKFSERNMEKKYSYLAEMVIGICVILIINFAWFGKNIGFVGISPNPYWLVVVFIAVRYGSLQGMAAGFLSSLVLLASVAYTAALANNFQSFSIKYPEIQLAGLFIIFGFLIGEERRRINKLLEKRKQEYAKLQNRFGDLALDNMACKDINVELQGRILSQVDSINTLYEAARKLATLRLDVLYPSIIDVVQKVIGPDKCSLYIWEDDNFVLKSHYGWGDEIREREVLDTDIGIIKMAINGKKLVTVKEVFKEKDQKWSEKTDPPMVAPLFFGENKDTVKGLILIDSISFLKLNPDSMRFLAIMADWVSRSLDNIYSTTSVSLKDYYDRELKVFNYRYAQRRVKEEFLNVEVTGKSSSLMLVKLRDFDSITKPLQKDVLKAIAFVLKNTCRVSDVVARYTLNDMFVIVLPGADEKGAKMVEDRIKKEIGAFAFKPFTDNVNKVLDINISKTIIYPTGKTESVLFKDAERQLYR